ARRHVCERSPRKLESRRNISSPSAAIVPRTFSTIPSIRRPVMRKSLTVSLLAAALAGFASAAEMKVAPTTSKIEFIGTKTGGRHTGGFKDFTGTVAIPGADLTGAAISIEITTSSIFTDTPKLTNHLKSGDFFDVNKHPKATFKSTA